MNLMSAKYLNELYDLVKILNDRDKTKLVQHLVDMMNTSANNLTSALIKMQEIVQSVHTPSTSKYYKNSTL